MGLSTIPMATFDQDFHTRKVVRGRRLRTVLTTHTVVAPKLDKKRELRAQWELQDRESQP